MTQAAATNPEPGFDAIQLMVQIKIDGMAYRLGLTSVETTVLNLLANGESDKEIGEAIGKTAPAARHHCRSVCRAFGVNTRAELLARLMGRR